MVPHRSFKNHVRKKNAVIAVLTPSLVPVVIQIDVAAERMVKLVVVIVVVLSLFVSV